MERRLSLILAQRARTRDYNTCRPYARDGTADHTSRSQPPLMIDGLHFAFLEKGAGGCEGTLWSNRVGRWTAYGTPVRSPYRPQAGELACVQDDTPRCNIERSECPDETSCRKSRMADQAAFGVARKSVGGTQYCNTETCYCVACTRSRTFRKGAQSRVSSPLHCTVLGSINANYLSRQKATSPLAVIRA